LRLYEAEVSKDEGDKALKTNEEKECCTGQGFRLEVFKESAEALEMQLKFQRVGK